MAVAHRSSRSRSPHGKRPLPQATGCHGPSMTADELLDVPASHFLHPMQRPEHVQPGLRCQPWYEPNEFVWCAGLEANFLALREEILAVMENTEAWPLVKGQVGLTGGRGAWRELVMLGEGSELGRRLCPKAAELLDQIPAAKRLADSPGSCGNAMFSKLTPGTHLKPHCGPTNARLTCHFGIAVPDGCGIRTGETTRCWNEGRCLIFDDSWEHEVWNNGTADRVVLLINFWHPDLEEHLWDEVAEELDEGFI
eukprot:TRINITY_DN39313_c0_g1_i2.p1 TRINITY_DN39313_c0_g1~~TRINITY_DN39313_c0_g1_i2.p1  ORF type:complete len:280 (+),score=25.47 TRINITY_DN39313_c0_g1_i2:84-842(+)